MSLINLNNKTTKILLENMDTSELVNAFIDSLNVIFPNSLKHYTYSTSKVRFTLHNITFERQLADVLLLVKHDGYTRFSFIKLVNSCKQKKDYDELTDFRGEYGQHLLLKQIPSFTWGGNGEFKSEILLHSKYETITSYVVFYNNKSGEIDFDFSSASSVSFAQKVVDADMDNHRHPLILKHNNEDLTKGIDHLLMDYVTFKNSEQLKQHFHIGEVVSPYENEKQYERLIELIKIQSKDCEILSFLKEGTEHCEVNNDVLVTSPLIKNIITLDLSSNKKL